MFKRRISICKSSKFGRELQIEDDADKYSMFEVTDWAFHGAAVSSR